MQSLHVSLFILLLCTSVKISVAAGTGDGDISAIEKECLPNEDQCSCTFNDGSGEVDLSSLGTTDNTPRFRDVPDESGQDKFSYSPCNGFNEGLCEDAAICLTTNPDEAKTIGDAGKARFGYNDETQSVTVVYQTGSSVLMFGEVELQCDPSACDPVLTPHGQASLGDYKFTLKSVCACPKLCDSNGPVDACQPSNSGSGSGAFSIGYIAIIVVFGAVVVYFVGGMAYSKVRLGASGTDLIPNKQFWISLPLRIKTGFLFTFQKCLPGKYQYSSVP